MNEPKVRIVRNWGIPGDVTVYESEYTTFESDMLKDGNGKEFIYIAGRVVPAGGSITVEVM